MQIFPLRFGMSFFTRTKKTINQQLKWFHSNILQFFQWIEIDLSVDLDNFMAIVDYQSAVF